MCMYTSLHGLQFSKILKFDLMVDLLHRFENCDSCRVIRSILETYSKLEQSNFKAVISRPGSSFQANLSSLLALATIVLPMLKASFGLSWNMVPVSIHKYTHTYTITHVYSIHRL